MFSKNHASWGLATILAVMFAAPPMVSADRDGDRRKSEAEADIEDLHARMRFEDGQWIMSVKYKVEIEDACEGEQFDLILALTECGRTLVDSTGREMTVNIPLDRPIKVEDHGEEVYFKDVITLPFADGVFEQVDKLKLEARVVPFGGGCALDDDDTKVHCESVVYHAPPPPPVFVPLPPPQPVLVPLPPPTTIMQPVGTYYRETRYYRQGGYVGVDTYGTQVRVRW